MPLHSNHGLEFYVHDFPFKDTESLSEVSTHSGHREGWKSFSLFLGLPSSPFPPGGVAWVVGGLVWLGVVSPPPFLCSLLPVGLGFLLGGGLGFRAPGSQTPPSSHPRVPRSLQPRP